MNTTCIKTKNMRNTTKNIKSNLAANSKLSQNEPITECHMHMTHK